MDEKQRMRLEAAGFRVGSAAEFVELSRAESVLIEMRLALGRAVQRPKHASKEFRRR